ncbi:hypothetical protein OQA88_11245 [Cercophora sp. LCS_1]
MKNSVVLLPALGWLAAARSCCKRNACLREVELAVEDCSSYLAVTVTPDVVTVYETISEFATDYATQVESQFVTVSETTVASTETVLATAKSTITVSTEVEETTTVEAVIASTETQLATVTANVARRQDETPFPDYASAACTSYKNYISACSCAKAKPTTVTIAPESTTVTVTDTASVLSTVLSTLTATTTATTSLTETTTSTTTDNSLLTDTLTTTKTSTTLLTTTTTAITTQTASTCLKGAALGAFKATFSLTEPGYPQGPLYVYANMLNGLSGGVNLQPGTVSTSPSIVNKYIWALDEQGRLNLAYTIPPYTYKYYAYVATASDGSLWPQIGTESSVASSVAASANSAYLTGCVDSVTGVLKLETIGGRGNILYCGNQMWISVGAGEDINRGLPCLVINPTIEKV